MKLKLDLHPIFSDGQKIERALQEIVDEACAKRAAEIEIIPGKGSGALKKSVIRFLDRPEIKAKYHRLEKDSENWGRLFVHFRWINQKVSPKRSNNVEQTSALPEAFCFCCSALLALRIDTGALSHACHSSRVECPACGSPNMLIQWLDRREVVHVRIEPGY